MMGHMKFRMNLFQIFISLNFEQTIKNRKKTKKEKNGCDLFVVCLLKFLTLKNFCLSVSWSEFCGWQPNPWFHIFVNLSFARTYASNSIWLQHIYTKIIIELKIISSHLEYFFIISFGCLQLRKKWIYWTSLSYKHF